MNPRNPDGTYLSLQNKNSDGTVVYGISHHYNPFMKPVFSVPTRTTIYKTVDPMNREHLEFIRDILQKNTLFRGVGAADSMRQDVLHRESYLSDYVRQLNK